MQRSPVAGPRSLPHRASSAPRPARGRGDPGPADHGAAACRVAERPVAYQTSRIGGVRARPRPPHRAVQGRRPPQRRRAPRSSAASRRPGPARRRRPRDLGRRRRDRRRRRSTTTSRPASARPAPSAAPAASAGSASWTAARVSRDSRRDALADAADAKLQTRPRRRTSSATPPSRSSPSRPSSRRPSSASTSGSCRSPATTSPPASVTPAACGRTTTRASTSRRPAAPPIHAVANGVVTSRRLRRRLRQQDRDHPR